MFHSPDLMLRRERAKLVPLSETTVWRMELRGEFPRRIQIARKRVAWSRREVEAWIKNRAAQRPAG